MGSISMLNKLTQLSDELLDLKELIIKTRHELMNAEEARLKKLEHVYASKELGEEVKELARKSERESRSAISRASKNLEELQEFQKKISKTLSEYNKEFGETIREVKETEKDSRERFKSDAAKQLEKLDKKISGFTVDNTQFKDESMKVFKELDASVRASIERIKALNADFHSEIKRKVDTIDSFTTTQLKEFYEKNESFKKFLQEQVLKVDDELRKRFAQEKNDLGEQFKRVVEVINQFYEMYYSKVSKDELRAYQSAIDQLEKRIERLEGVREYENV